MECDESKETIVALVSHDCCTRVGQPALLRKTEERRSLQCVDRCAPDLERELGLTVRQFPLKERSACRAMPSRATGLRGAFAPFFGKANVSDRIPRVCNTILHVVTPT